MEGWECTFYGAVGCPHPPPPLLQFSPCLLIWPPWRSI